MAGDIETNQNTGRQGMRPTYTVSLKDRKITLHDDVFMDNSDDEPKLEKILKLHEEVHCTLSLKVLYLANSWQEVALHDA